MRVLLRASALRSTDHASRLPALLDFAIQGKHDILLDPCDPEVNSAWDDWSESIGILGAPYQRAINDSNERQATRWSNRELIVEDPPTSKVAPGQLSLAIADAIGFLQRPLEIGVEDETSDGVFLNSVVPPSLRQDWKHLVSIGAVKLWNLGGITQAPRRLRTRVDSDPNRRTLLRLVVLIDSDAPLPWQAYTDLPTQAQEVVRQATELEVPFFVLRRRMVENYTPPPALKRWTKTLPRGARAKKCPHADAFASLSAERRHHHHLKDGIKPTENEHYASEPLTQDQVDALTAPLGSTAYMALEHAVEDELHHDGVYDEMTPIFQAIFCLA